MQSGLHSASQLQFIEMRFDAGFPVLPICGTLCHFAQLSSGNSVAPLLLLCFMFLRLSWLTFCCLLLAICGVCEHHANERSTAYCPPKINLRNVRWDSSRPLPWCLWCLLRVQNPSQSFATVEISEAIEGVKSSMFMLVSCKLLKRW